MALLITPYLAKMNTEDGNEINSFSAFVAIYFESHGTRRVCV